MNARVDPLAVAQGILLGGKLVTELFQVVRGDQVIALTAEKEFAEQLAAGANAVAAVAIAGLKQEVEQLRAGRDEITKALVEVAGLPRTERTLASDVRTAFEVFQGQLNALTRQQEGK